METRLSPGWVATQFDAAESPAAFRLAERDARRLQPVDQLKVVDALRAAEARLGLK